MMPTVNMIKPQNSQCVQTSLMRRIIEIIDEYNFENVNIELEDNLESHLGIDKEMKISLQSDLEDEWCINISSVDFYNTDTVQDVLDMLGNMSPNLLIKETIVANFNKINGYDNQNTVNY